jgi:uncharacterized protein
MKKTPFVGRFQELKQLENLTRKQSASLVVISGRRRIGKSRLIEEFGQKSRFLRFSGIPPTINITKQDQKNEFIRQLKQITGLSSIHTTDWGDLFSLLAREVSTGKVIILFDEVSWMGHNDPLFLGKLKNAWDLEFKSNPELILVLCGSVSSWIEKNILQNTGFVGRISLNLQLKELLLPESNQLLDAIGFRGSEYDKFKLLSIMGGVPRYLEEVLPHLTAELNIQQLCYQSSGVLFREFNDIFSDLFSEKIVSYKKIVCALVDGLKSPEEISKITQLSRGSYFSECLNDLIQLGFIQRDYTWSIKSKKTSKLSVLRLSDNYLRFYLKYVEPHYSKIVNSPVKNIHLNMTDSILGLQFENLVLANRHLIWKNIPIQSNDIVYESPFFQRRTVRTKGCQIDYLVQTRFQNLFVCEVKFSKNPIGNQVVEEVKEKIQRLSLPRGFSCWPILIHVNGVTDSVIDSEYFCQIIGFSSLLKDGNFLLNQNNPQVNQEETLQLI